MNENKQPSLQRAIAIFIGGTIFFTLPYGFVWYLVKGGDFRTGFTLYIKIIAVASTLIGTVSSLTAGLIKFLRIPLEKKPELPDFYMVPAIVIILGATIAAGIADGAQTSMLVFWPSAFFSMCVVHSIHWIQYQIKNIRSRRNV